MTHNGYTITVTENTTPNGRTLYQAIVTQYNYTAVTNEYNFKSSAIAQAKRIADRDKLNRI